MSNLIVKNIADLGFGVVDEMFEDAHKAVLENILDPNTSAMATREITIKISMKPGKDRKGASVKIACTKKLAPVEPFETTVWIAKDKDELVSVQHAPDQLSLFDEPEDIETKVRIVKGVNG
jgi:hypothetical protein